MGNAVKMGSAYVTIGAKTGDLAKALGSVRKSLQNAFKGMEEIGTKLAGIGAAMQAPLDLAVQRLASFGDGMAKGAKRAGISVEAYSEFAHVAGLSGTSVQKLEKALLVMARGMLDAKNGTGEMLVGMKELGLSMADLEGMSPDERFTALAEAIRQIEDPGTKAAVAMKVFGKSGADLIPLMDLGAAGIKHYREEAQRLGISMSSGQATAAERLTDMWARLQASMQGLANTVGTVVAPYFDKLLTMATNLTANFRTFLENNPQVVQSFMEISGALVAVGTSMIAIGKAGGVLSELISPGGVLVGLVALGAYMSGVFDDLIDKYGEMIGAFQVGGRSLSDWAGTIGKLWGELTPAFKGGLDALVAVFDYAWASIKVGFVALVQYLKETFGGLIKEIGGQLLKNPLTFDVGSELYFAGGKMETDSIMAKRYGASKKAETEQQAAAERMGVALDGAAEKFRLGLSGAGAVLETDVAPVIESIFGDRKAGPIKSFTDIFQGLGQSFKEFVAPTLPEIAQPGAQAARFTTTNLGSFSSTALAQSETKGGSRMVKLAEAQVAELKKVNARGDRLAARNLGDFNAAYAAGAV